MRQYKKQVVAAASTAACGRKCSVSYRGLQRLKGNGERSSVRVDVTFRYTFFPRTKERRIALLYALLAVEMETRYAIVTKIY